MDHYYYIKKPIKKKVDISFVKRVFFTILFSIFTTAPLLSGDTNRTIEDRSLDFLNDYKVATKVSQTRERRRLGKILSESSGEEIKAISALKLARLFNPTSPKLALQYLKIAESKLTKSQSGIKDLVYTDLSELYLNLNQYRDAIETLAMINAPEEKTLRAKYYLAYSLAHSKLNNHREAVKYLKMTVDDINVKNLPDSFLLSLANSFNNLKMSKYEYRFLEVLASRYPFSQSSHEALTLLKDYTKLKRNSYHFSGTLLRKLKLHAAVFPELEKSLPEFLNLPVEIDGKMVTNVTPLQKADLAMNLNLDEIAMDILEDVRAGKRLSQSEESEWILLQARWHLRDGDHSQALEFYEQHRKKFPYLSQTERLQARVASIYSELGEYSEAAKAYGKHAKRTNRRIDRWRHFWALYRSGQYAEALAKLETKGYVKGHDDYRSDAEVTYWRAKILEKLGRTKEAAVGYSELLVNKPDHYYSVLIKARLHELHSTLKPGTETSAIFLRVRDAVVGYLTGASRILLAARGDTTNISAPLENNEDLQNRKLISFLSKPASFKLNSQSEAVLEEKIFESYPKAFQKIVEPHADRIKLDPYLTFSIMKAESDFDKDAISWVGAIGLMQIMPYTGFRIAKELGDKNYEFENLQAPHINITYAQYYLKRLTNYFGGNFIYAIAAYNGGPDAVNRWIDQCQGCNMDEFVESITYQETRKYVKKVLKNYAVYKSFYEDSLPLVSWPKVELRAESDENLF